MSRLAMLGGEWKCPSAQTPLALSRSLARNHTQHKPGKKRRPGTPLKLLSSIHLNTSSHREHSTINPPHRLHRPSPSSQGEGHGIPSNGPRTLRTTRIASGLTSQERGQKHNRVAEEQFARTSRRRPVCPFPSRHTLPGREHPRSSKRHIDKSLPSSSTSLPIDDGLAGRDLLHG